MQGVIWLSGPAALTLPSLSTMSDRPAEGLPRRRPGDGGTTDGRSLCLEYEADDEELVWCDPNQARGVQCLRGGGLVESWVFAR